MPSDSKQDLRSLTLAELMAGLDEPVQPVRSSAEIWLESEGWRPGSTKRAGTELYPKYLKWLEAHPEVGSLLGVREWGKVMTARFKKGRAATGYFYYISRESDAEVVRKVTQDF